MRAALINCAVGPIGLMDIWRDLFNTWQIARPSNLIGSQMVSYKYYILWCQWFLTQNPASFCLSSATSPYSFIIWLFHKSQANQHSHFSWEPPHPCFLHVYCHLNSLASFQKSWASEILFRLQHILPWEEILFDMVNELKLGNQMCSFMPPLISALWTTFPDLPGAKQPHVANKQARFGLFGLHHPKIRLTCQCLTTF